MPALDVRGVTKAYGTKVAVDSASFSVDRGEIFGLLGPNGAGKSSLIRMVMDILRPDSGEIRVLDGAPGVHERIGYLPEERGLYQRQRVGDVLQFLGELKGLARHVADRRVDQYLDRVGLLETRKKRMRELSKGMQQKIQFVAALLHDPDLLILDEPFSGLDPANAVMLKDAMIELKKAGKTILFSTHRMDQVERLCDSICLIDHGHSVLEGDLKKIKASYGKNTIQMQYEGNPSFDHDELIESVNNYGNYVELRLKPGADAQQLLRMACERARISRFELMEPSLEEIFIDTVKQHA